MGNKIKDFEKKKLKTYNVSWCEEVNYSIDVEAESKEKAKKMLLDGEIELNEADTESGNFLDGSVEVEEVEQ